MDFSFLLDQYGIRSLAELEAKLPLILRQVALDLIDEAKRRNLPQHAVFAPPSTPGALDLQSLDEMRPVVGGVQP